MLVSTFIETVLCTGGSGRPPAALRCQFYRVSMKMLSQDFFDCSINITEQIVLYMTDCIFARQHQSTEAVNDLKINDLLTGWPRSSSAVCLRAVNFSFIMEVKVLLHNRKHS